MSIYAGDPNPPFSGSSPAMPPAATVRDITLTKSAAGFGFSLRGANPVYILAITPDGAAAQAGIRVGDEILSINDQDVSAASHDEVVSVFKSAGPVIFLKVRAVEAQKAQPGPDITIDPPHGSDSVSLAPSMASVASLEELSNGGNDSATPSEVEDEQEAFKPFRSLDLLVHRPAHLATYLHYILTNNEAEEDILLFLSIQWFQYQNQPEKDEALAIFEDFIATKAPVRVHNISQDIFQELERSLNDKAPDFAKLKMLYGKIADSLHEQLSNSLRQFEDLVINLGLGSIYGVSLLVDLQEAEEANVVEEMLKPHLEATKAESEERPPNPEGQGRSEVVDEILLGFMARAGVNIEKYQMPGRTKRTRSRSFRRNRADGSFFKKQRKVHLHSGHHFVTMNYQQPTFCGVCKNLLWGVYRQGWNCMDCGFNVHKANDMTGHKKCHLMIEKQCEGVRQRKKTWNAFGFSKQRKMGGSVKNQRPSELSPGDKPTRAVSESGLNKLVSDQHEAERPIEALDSEEQLPAVAAEPASLDASQQSQSGRPSSPFAEIQRFSHLRKSRNQAVAVTALPPLEITLNLPEDPTTEPQFWCELVQAADAKLLKKIDKREVKRQECIYELIQTERNYLRHLAILQQLFRQPIVDDGLFGHGQLMGLFANLDDLVFMNQPLCDALRTLQKQHGTDPILKIGRTFLDNFSKIDPQAYAVFCANQLHSIELYHEKMRGYAPFSSRIKQCENHPASDRLSFTDFIAKPLQRLTKYPLLLKSILDKTSKSDKEEIEALTASMEKTEELLRFVQKAVKESEDLARLQEINEKLDRAMLNSVERQFVRDILEPSIFLGDNRTLVTEGPIQLRGNDKKLIDVHAILLTDMLLLVQPREGKLVMRFPGRDKKRSAIIFLGTAMVRSVATDTKGFFVINTSRYSMTDEPQMYELICPSKTINKEWISKIESAIASFKQSSSDWETPLRAIMNTNPEPVPVPEEDEEESVETDPVTEAINEHIEQLRVNYDSSTDVLARLNALMSEMGVQMPARIVKRSTRSDNRRRAVRSRAHSHAVPMKQSSFESDIADPPSSPAPVSSASDAVSLAATSIASDSRDGEDSELLLAMRTELMEYKARYARAVTELSQFQHEVGELRAELFRVLNQEKNLAAPEMQDVEYGSDSPVPVIEPPQLVDEPTTEMAPPPMPDERGSERARLALRAMSDDSVFTDLAKEVCEESFI
eukprot:m.293314 g.293314  ORF g.293314 m.293314 type:complete len:1218 (+) comp12766_c0_seq1:196-3849(+)